MTPENAQALPTPLHDRPSGRPTAPYVEEPPVPATELLRTLLRRWPLVFGLPILFVALVTAYRLSRPREYASAGSFVPQASAGARVALSGLAAQLGVNVGATEPGQSPQFYAELLHSREVTRAVLDSPLVAPPGAGAGTRRVSFAELMQIDAPNPALRREREIRRLVQITKVSTDRETGIVRFSVSTGWPTVSEQIASRLLAEINEFNLSRRQARAAAERRFSEQRVAEARQELARAVGQLNAFTRSNRVYDQSPDLLAEHERLQRAVSFREQLYTSVAQAFEQARIDEVRDVPVITVIEHPEVPAVPVSRGIARNGALAGAFAFALAVFVAFLLEYLASARRSAARAAGA